MKFYHVTTYKAVRSIQRTGFKDSIGSFGIIDRKTGKQKLLKGVFLSDVILSSNEGADPDSDSVLVVDIPEKIIARFELVQNGSYREWCIPAKIVNKFFVDRKIYSWYDDLLYT